MHHLNTSSSNSTTLNTGNLAPSVVLGLCCLIGVPGNIAVVVMIGRNFKRENFTLKLMLNLAVSDLLSLITLPMWMYNLLHNWELGRALCKFIAYLAFGCQYSSVFTVTLMSIHRYVSVLYPQQWAKLHGMGEKVLLVTVWGLSGILAAPNIVVWDVRIEEDGCDVCKRSFRSDGRKVAVLLVENMFGFLVPFTILATSYLCLCNKVNQTTFFRNQRMTKLVISIVTTFFIFWLPLQISNILGILEGSCKVNTLKITYKNSWTITATLTFINNCVNPFLYFFASRNLRRDTQQTERHQDVQPAES